ncbi:MAG: hypothetical protein OQL06_08260 [Gammaproteobacteria bacterium]|nr:hypothetical protein [Gammaproteobacteria bacterium]
MITQAQQQLANINRAYFEGQLSFTDYRQRRDLILDSLYDDVAIEDDMDSDTVPMNNPVPASTREKDSSVKFMYIPLLILIISFAIAASFILAEKPAKVPAAVQPGTVETPENSLQLLVEEHLSNSNWTPSLIDEIESLWRTMSTEQRNAAQQSDWYPKLTNRLDNLLSEQKTRIESGNTDAPAFERQILGLVETLKK